MPAMIDFLPKVVFRPFLASLPGCTKAFSQLSNLQSHSRCHQTDKPYKCNSCYKCFSDEQSLFEHIPKHKESKHIKTHICSYCGKSYTQVSADKTRCRTISVLSSHMRVTLPLFQHSVMETLSLQITLSLMCRNANKTLRQFNIWQLVQFCGTVDVNIRIDV